jgi:hypothetical protein
MYMADTFTTTTFPLAADDVLKMFKIPNGVRILYLVYQVTDCDSGGSPALVLDIALDEDGTETQLVTSLGQAAAGPTWVIPAAGKRSLTDEVNATTNGYGEIVFSVTTAAATAAGGTLRVGVMYE